MDDIILYEERRRDMMKLWKDTFHDSDRYIRLVFDNYFSLDNSFVKYHENRIIAALLCVDYEFQILTKEGKKQIRGMYLCGLATHPDWRRKGIMGSLMEEAENAAKSRGYEMTFLIPADDHLRLYYARKGYETLSWRRRLVENMRIDSSFENPDKSHIYSIQDFLKRGQREFLSLLAEWCRQIEVKRKFDTILHSVEDFIVIMEENENSIFITDSSFDPEYPILAKVRGVAFPEVSEGFSDPLRIVGLYTQEKFMDEDNGSREEEIREPEGKEEEFEPEILGDILKEFQKSNLELLLPYSGESDQDGEVEPYAMIKILDENRKMLQSDENRKFEISLMLD